MRTGMVSYATSQGLGYLAKSFHDAGIVQEVMIFNYPRRKNHLEWYANPTVLHKRPFVGPQVEHFLSKVDAVIFFETPFDWSFLTRCRERGVKTACVVMHEWWPLSPPERFDLMICPSLLDCDYFPNMEKLPSNITKNWSSVFLPVPAVQRIWKLRTRACRFVHNAGHMGSRNHKGTLELLKAIPLCKSPFEMVIRSQEPVLLQKMIDAVPEVKHDPRVHFEFGDRPWEELWAEADVLVQPEKYNGLSLPLQEACAAGLLVMTTDRYPANTWLPKAPLIPVANHQEVSVRPGYLAIEESLVEPVDIATTIDAWHGKDITGFSEAGRFWAEANSWEVWKPTYLEVLEALCNQPKINRMEAMA